jgi:hypothetical protein
MDFCLRTGQQKEGVERVLRSAKKLDLLKGHDFSRAVNLLESTRALAPEGCFSSVSPGISPFFRSLFSRGGTKFALCPAAYKTKRGNAF